MSEEIKKERIIKLKEVIHRVGMGKTSIYAGVKDTTFPKPVKIGNSTGWIESEIDQFIDDKIKARDQQQVAA